MADAEPPWDEQLADLIEPDFGLLDHLQSTSKLTRRQVDEIRCQKTLYRKNSELLELFDTNEPGHRFDRLLEPLERNGQKHVANFIRHVNNGRYKLIALICDMTGCFTVTILARSGVSPALRPRN